MPFHELIGTVQGRAARHLELAEEACRQGAMLFDYPPESLSNVDFRSLSRISEVQFVRIRR